MRTQIWPSQGLKSTWTACTCGDKRPSVQGAGERGCSFHWPMGGPGWRPEGRRLPAMQSRAPPSAHTPARARWPSQPLLWLWKSERWVGRPLGGEVPGGACPPTCWARRSAASMASTRCATASLTRRKRSLSSATVRSRPSLALQGTSSSRAALTSFSESSRALWLLASFFSSWGRKPRNTGLWGTRHGWTSFPFNCPQGQSPSQATGRMGPLGRSYILYTTGISHKGNHSLRSSKGQPPCQHGTIWALKRNISV